MNTKTEKLPLVTEGVILAAVSAFAYFTTFLYEYGYCKYFGIPSSLISPNASTFLVAAFALGATLLPAINFLAFTTPLFKAARNPKLRPYRDVFAFLALLSAAGVLLGAIYGVSLRGIALYVGASTAFMAFAFLPALLTNRNLSIAERLSRHADIQEQDPFVATNLFEGWLSRRNILFAMLALIALLIAYLVGDAEARGKSKFLALKNEPDVVLLRNYGDLMIFAKITKSGDQLTGLRLLWLSETKELDLVPRDTGPMKKTVPQKAQEVRAPTTGSAIPRPTVTPPRPAP